MGTNSSKYDSEARYNAMTTKDLVALRDWWDTRLKEHDFPLGREEVARIRMKIAERIGKPSRVGQ